LAHKRHICAGATSHSESRFFTADAEFGFDGWYGSVVDATGPPQDQDYETDSGRYLIGAGHTFEIDDDVPYLGRGIYGGASFRYRIVNGETLTLTPLITQGMKADALAHPLRFSTAGWMVSVAMTGQKWKRIPCNQWC